MEFKPDLAASNPSIDFTNELAQLLLFTGEIGLAIQKLSAYKAGKKGNFSFSGELNLFKLHILLGKPDNNEVSTQPNVDLIFLSDAIAQVSEINRLIRGCIEINNYSELVKYLEKTINLYKGYLKPLPQNTIGFKGDPYLTFSNEYLQNFVDLEFAISIMNAMIEKCLKNKNRG